MRARHHAAVLVFGDRRLGERPRAAGNGRRERLARAARAQRDVADAVAVALDVLGDRAAGAAPRSARA